MTTSFYVPSPFIKGSAHVVLPEEEAAHAVRVLRKRPGDEIVVVDGEGGWYRVRLDQVDRRKATGTILEQARDVGEPAYDLSIGLGLLKHRGRYETFLEKAVELGVRTIIPLVTQRTEKAHLRGHRAEKVLIAAMKQCGRSRLVRLLDPTPLAQVLAEQTYDLALMAHERTPPSHHLHSVLTPFASASRLCVLIGPEGGFAEEEVADAQQAGFRPVSLGPRRLRAETAALVAASTVMMAYESVDAHE